jgi:hypothetical protein
VLLKVGKGISSISVLSSESQSSRPRGASHMIILPSRSTGILLDNPPLVADASIVGVAKEAGELIP